MTLEQLFAWKDLNGACRIVRIISATIETAEKDAKHFADIQDVSTDEHFKAIPISTLEAIPPEFKLYE